MKRKLLLLLLLSLSFFCFSQTEKLISGKVSCQGDFIKGVDVINFNSKKNTTTTEFGDFFLIAKANDVLVFISEAYLDKQIIVTQNEIDKNNLVISLIKKPIELKEVEITKTMSLKVDANYNDFNSIKLEKQQARPTNGSVYTGEIVNGMDFVEIGKMIGRLFKSKAPKSKPKKKQEKIEFKDYAKSNFNESFFSKTLALTPDEIHRFLEYCEADPNSKTIIEKNDELSILEFLLTKKEAFKKLK